MKVKVLTLFALFVCSWGAFGQRGSSFYVSPTGNDANPGTQAYRGVRFNMRQIRRVQEVPSTCEAEPTRSA